MINFKENKKQNNYYRQKSIQKDKKKPTEGHKIKIRKNKVFKEGKEKTCHITALKKNLFFFFLKYRQLKL